MCFLQHNDQREHDHKINVTSNSTVFQFGYPSYNFSATLVSFYRGVENR